MPERNIFVQQWVGWPGNHLDLMAKIFECPRKILEIYTLSAAVGITAVAQ